MEQITKYNKIVKWSDKNDKTTLETYLNSTVRKTDRNCSDSLSSDTENYKT